MTDLWITVIIIVLAVSVHLFTKAIKQLSEDIDSLRDSVNDLYKHTNSLHDHVYSTERDLGELIIKMVEQVKEEHKR